ncbi:AMOP domain protein [Cooperia oncophora]
MRLDIGNIHPWVLIRPPAQMTLKWYPRNFTALRTFAATETVNYFDDSIYNVQLGLYVVGYKEAQDDNLRKFVPQHRVLARLATYQNRVDEQHRWNPIIESYQLDRVDEWYLSRYEMHEELFTYRLGYLKLAPMVQTETQATTDRGRIVDLPEGYSREMCHSWFDEDGALSNFIRETETNSSCPCKEEQAKMDIGRFMPHPRCSALFRDVSCTETLGSMNCYMSAQNVRGFNVPHELRRPMISAPISLHWLWTLPPEGEFQGNKQDKQEKLTFRQGEVGSTKDGALSNFIRETETNSSCPCKEEQAKMDIGRFMPHPRCSALFRDVSCTETLGSMNCYMSAQNVRGSTYRMNYEGREQESAYFHPLWADLLLRRTRFLDAVHLPARLSRELIIIWLLQIDESTPYSPGVPTRAFELGSAPFQGMFEVPGLSTFHHDIMPYYLCCKFADFRCQLFYWRRPSSACQAYEPAVSGSILGAGIVSTLNNRNFIFNEPGIFTLLHSHRTSSTPEVQIQVRMERFPDRSVDFGALNIAQRDLVQPTNATVITGVVLSSESADRVHVVLRKDTYRQRYKTSVIVGNVIRYFDNMHIQRFRGVTVYVNNVEKGQSEIYVVLDEAQIGLRIRESYAIDIDRKFNYMESLGLLDVQISVPPQYKVLSSPSMTRTADTPRVEGLINPFPEEPFQQQFSQLTWTSVNDQSIRGQLMKCRSCCKMENKDSAENALQKARR